MKIIKVFPKYCLDLGQHVQENEHTMNLILEDGYQHISNKEGVKELKSKIKA